MKNLKIHAVQYNENFVVAICKKACGRKWESNNQLCLA